MSNLTSDDVRNVAFRKPALGRRGYDEREVDMFLDAVESTIAALTKEVEELRARLDGSPPPGRPDSTDDPLLVELAQLKERVALLETAVLGADPAIR
ncbi:DivIVA domain-containing protein [Micromonospora sp. NBC_01813]|uniref:DivIVA domain-containing protein n=1 Tax=Micromonospora sp. NBC_01813 TaxID=2975988 RepID=UPI002DDA5F0D|nr:DivIVA domain-containing protein [Micromonospora sp. NBC_01813]WSA08533.1 DivIVA domain-containing protein [Micromonospora sp. NBC_01813]